MFLSLMTLAPPRAQQHPDNNWDIVSSSNMRLSLGHCHHHTQHLQETCQVCVGWHQQCATLLGVRSQCIQGGGRMWIPYIGLGGRGSSRGVEIFFVTYIRKALQSAQITLTKKLGSSDVQQTPNLHICCLKLWRQGGDVCSCSQKK